MRGPNPRRRGVGNRRVGMEAQAREEGHSAEVIDTASALWLLGSLDEERLANATWDRPGQGVDLSALAGLLGVRPAGSSPTAAPVGLTAAGTHLQTFSGLSEGVVTLRP